MRFAAPASPLLLLLTLASLNGCPEAKNETRVDAGVPDAGPVSDGGLLQTCDRQVPTCLPGQSCMLAQSPPTLSFCFPGECDLFLQNCDGGQACGYNATGSRACLTPGPLEEDNPCTGGACQTGLLCVADANGQNPVCRRLCTRTSDCLNPKECLGTAGLPGNNEAFTYCISPPPPCDLLGQDCLVSGESCYLTSTGTACFATGPLSLGADCSVGRCGHGATCALVGNSSRCVEICQFPLGTPSCNAGTCQQLSTGGTPVLDGGVGGCF